MGRLWSDLGPIIIYLISAHLLCLTCIDHLYLLLQHELFDKFLMFSEGREPPFQAQDTLRAWQEKVKSLLSFSTSWPHPPELDTVLFRTTPGLSWATYTRRPLRISGSQWSHSTWASGRGMWHISLLLRLILPILDVSRENQQNNVFWWRYCIRYIVLLWQH